MCPAFFLQDTLDPIREKPQNKATPPSQARMPKSPPWGSGASQAAANTGLPSLIPGFKGIGLPALGSKMARPMMALVNTTSEVIAGASERTQRLLDQARAGYDNLFKSAAATNTAILRQDTEGLLKMVAQQRSELMAQLGKVAGLQQPGSTFMGRVNELARNAALPNLLTVLGGGTPATPGVPTVGVASTQGDAQRVLAAAASAKAGGSTASGAGSLSSSTTPASSTVVAPLKPATDASSGTVTQQWQLQFPTIDDGSEELVPGNPAALPLGGLPRLQASGPMPALGASSSEGPLGGGNLGNIMGLPLANLQSLPGRTTSTKEIDTGDSELSVSDLLDVDSTFENGPFPLPQQPAGGNLLAAAIPHFRGTQTPATPQATPAASR